MDEHTKTTLENMWREADLRRGESAPDITSLLQKVAGGEIQGELDSELLEEILAAPHQRRDMGECFSPPPITDFVARLAASRKPKSILDPTCGSGLMLQKVTEASQAEVIDGVEINATMSMIANKLLGSSASIHNGDLFTVEQELRDAYDLIVADPPMNLRQFRRSEMDADPNGPGAREFTEALSCWACQHLAENGLAVILTTDRVVTNDRFRSRLQKFGGRLRGVIHVPAGMMLHTSIPTNLMLIERGPQEPLFVAELSHESGRQDQILERFQVPAEHTGHPAMGIWVDPADFLGYRVLANQYRAKTRARGTRYELIPAEKVFKGLSRNIDRSAALDELDIESGIFLVHSTGRQIYYSADDLPSNTRNCIRVHLNTELVNPRYFVYWFHSEWGRLLIESVSGGAVAQIISLDRLMHSVLPLPPLAEQGAVVSALRKMDAIQAEIEETRSRCWDGTTEADQIEAAVQNINLEDTFDGWVETLPYPLASILWRHKTAPDSAIIRMPILNHFFEAMAEFLATIHLSAFTSDSDEWAVIQPELLRRLEKVNLSFERATFGTWKCVCESLGKFARTWLKSEDRSELIQSLYQLHDEAFLKTIFSAELVQILSAANKLRNTHLGHGGAMSEQEAIAVEAEYMKLVQDTRSLFGLHWKSYELVQASHMRYRNGEYQQRVPLLVGTRSLFTRVDRVTASPMEEGALYLLGRGEAHGLKLLPFLRMGASPASETNACYFFNRTEKAGLRFVSYHFEQNAELQDMFDDTQQAISMITQIPKLPGQEDDQ